MAVDKNTQPNIDDSNLTAYPNGQIKDDSGSNDGTAVARITMSDQFEFFAKLMRLANITYNNSFDNETNGYQYVQALIALAGKNDYVYSIGSTAGVLQIATNIDILNTNEVILGIAAQDWTSETQIKGTSATLKTISITRQYKANDYLLMVNNGGNIAIISLTTADNLNVQVGELAYLKAASNSDEDAGTSITKATTPASNKYIFTKRVTDPTAAIPFLATITTPGLLSAADKVAINRFSSLKNVGWINGIDPGSGTIGSFYGISGDITNAQVTGTYGPYYNASGIDVGDGTVILVTMANAMTNLNYFVRFSIESTGTLPIDSTAWQPIFKVISTTQFSIVIRDGADGSQSLKLHLEVVQLS